MGCLGLPSEKPALVVCPASRPRVAAGQQACGSAVCQASCAGLGSSPAVRTGSWSAAPPAVDGLGEPTSHISRFTKMRLYMSWAEPIWTGMSASGDPAACSILSLDKRWAAQGPSKQASSEGVLPKGPGPIFWEPPHLSSAVPHLRDGLHHGEPHEDGADSVVLPVVRQPTDAVVTVAQDLNPQLVVFLKG